MLFLSSGTEPCVKNGDTNPDPNASCMGFTIVKIAVVEKELWALTSGVAVMHRLAMSSTMAPAQPHSSHQHSNPTPQVFDQGLPAQTQYPSTLYNLIDRDAQQYGIGLAIPRHLSVSGHPTPLTAGLSIRIELCKQGACRPSGSKCGIIR
jgi:hypothetical protein